MPTPPGLSQTLVAKVTGGTFLEPDMLEKVRYTYIHVIVFYVDHDMYIYLDRHFALIMHKTTPITLLHTLYMHHNKMRIEKLAQCYMYM